MYFYRLLTLEELSERKVHNNEHKFDECINTHKYVEGNSYVHLFLNAESCFEDFEKEDYKKCYIAKFNIPDEIVCKYGIGLGGYDAIFNPYNNKYRLVSTQAVFWVPEIAIASNDFNYNWLESVCPAIDKLGKHYLPENFITEDNDYKEIVYDGYLLGYKDEKELLKKYEDIINLKRHIINVLKTTRRINILTKDFNEDSIRACYSLVNYGFINGYIEHTGDVNLISNDSIDSEAINIASKIEANCVINKKYNYTNPSFCAKLKQLGIDVSENMVYDIHDQKIKKLY